MLILLVIVILFGLIYIKKSVSNSGEKEIVTCNTNGEEEKSRIVYIAHSSKKYHNSGCHFILGEEIPIGVEDARSKGYLSCKKCNPK